MRSLSSSPICSSTNCSRWCSRLRSALSPSGNLAPSRTRTPSRCSRKSFLTCMRTPCPASKALIRLMCRVRSFDHLAMQLPMIFLLHRGYVHHVHTFFSRPWYQSSMVSSFSTSRLSVFARRRLRLTSMLEESTTRFLTPMLSRKRCSQPVLPAPVAQAQVDGQSREAVPPRLVACAVARQCNSTQAHLEAIRTAPSLVRSPAPECPGRPLGCSVHEGVA